MTSGLFTSGSDIVVTLSELPLTPTVTIEGNHLSSSAAQGNQWYNSQGIIEGATGHTFIPFHTDSYYTIVTNTAGCHSQASNQVYYGFTGIKPPDEDQGFKTYPNPFSDKLFITYTLTESTAVRIVLYNAFGSEIIELKEGDRSPGTYKVSLDGSSLPAGIYYCRLFTADKTLVTKVILNR